MTHPLDPFNLRGEQPGATDGLHWFGSGPVLDILSPIDGSALGTVRSATPDETDRIVAAACAAFLAWREQPAPTRGALVRAYSNLLRHHKSDLARLVTWETGKILSEGEGEVQEMIDICDFALGLSRQLYGRVIASERPSHRLLEQWHPLGPVACLTAFNFPVAVWAWNAALAWTCGNPVLWKPSDRTPFTAIACVRLFQQACRDTGHDPRIATLAVGGAPLGAALAADPRIPLVSATGSCAMGRQVAQTVARRLGRSLLELGGNNAVIVCPSADVDLALRAVVFGAAGTAGQRCTSTRRLFVHRTIHACFTEALCRAFRSLNVGSPLDPATHVGPLISLEAVARMQSALDQLRAEGGSVLEGGQPLDGPDTPGGRYVRPSLAAPARHDGIVLEETFAPLLHIFPFDDLDAAIALQNSVPQGLSSAIFTNDLRESERFLSAAGSDCGLANVNAGTSGAEIGGAFGGEKDTGGGRESGSDAWKAYMRRQTVTLNASASLPLAQGVRFDLT